MSWGQCARSVLRYSAFMTSQIQPIIKTTYNPAAFIFKKNVLPKDILRILPSSIANASRGHKKEINEPMSIIYNKQTPPIQKSILDMILPNPKATEFIVPPTENVQEKRAARLIVIRRAKMKKHKWRKLQKRMKFEFAKRRQKRELKKEKDFQAVLLAQVKEAERFDAAAYVAGKIKTAHWEKPITRVRGFYAPDWVIRDHLQNQENKRKLNERIQHCLHLKK